MELQQRMKMVLDRFKEVDAFHQTETLQPLEMPGFNSGSVNAMEV